MTYCSENLRLSGRTILLISSFGKIRVFAEKSGTIEGKNNKRRLNARFMCKTRKIILTIFAAIILLMCEIAIISRTTGINKSKEAIIVSEDIQQGEIISKEKLSTAKIFNNGKESIYLTDINEINGKTALREMKKGEIILKEMMKTMSIEKKKDDEDTRYISIELKPDQANSWNVRKGQLIDILFVPEAKIDDRQYMQMQEQKTTDQPGIERSINMGMNVEKNGDVFRLRNIEVDSIFDESGRDVSNVSSRTFMPRYICLKVRKGEDDFLAAAKKGGMLNISVLPTEQ